MPAEGQPSRQAGSVAKRRKISLACEACRTRKARCNGAKPQCGNCVQRHERCVYKRTSAHLADTNEYIDSLLNRVADLEGEIQQSRDALSAASAMQLLGQSQPGTPSAGLGPILASDGRRRESHEALLLAAADTHQDPKSISPTNCIVDISSPVDGMGGNASSVDLPDMDEKFYGSSSSMSFMKQFYNMILRNGDTAAAPQTEVSGCRTTVNEPQQNSGSLPRPCFGGPESFSLMPRVLTDYLLDLYWNRSHHVYPFLHRATFMAAYEQLWAPASTQSIPQRPRLGLGGSDQCGYTSSVFHCALNAMMILGVQFSDLPLAQRNSLVATLTLKCKSQFDLDLFDDGSIHVIQTLLLLVQIFQFTTFPTRCWSTMGAACRLAQGLGLHLPDGQLHGHFEPVEIELRKRIWHACAMLDMIVSMTLGRPAMLHQSSGVALPTAIDDEYLDRNQPQPLDQVSYMEFFVESIKLDTTLSKILSRIYGQETDRLDTLCGYGSFDLLIELDRELAKFADQVPETLKWTYEDGEFLRRSPPLGQQTNILHARHLHLRILLFRPSLTQFCRLNSSSARFTSSKKDRSNASPASSLATSFAQCSSLTCVRSAIDLIDMTERQAATNESGAWWYSMFYIRTAAMVILLADVCAPVRESIGSATLASSWQKCRTTLRYKLPQETLVQTCLQTLEKMHEQVLTLRSISNPADLGLGSGIGIGHGQVSTEQQEGHYAPAEHPKRQWSVFQQPPRPVRVRDFGQSEDPMLRQDDLRPTLRLVDDCRHDFRGGAAVTETTTSFPHRAMLPLASVQVTREDAPSRGFPLPCTCCIASSLGAELPLKSIFLFEAFSNSTDSASISAGSARTFTNSTGIDPDFQGLGLDGTDVMIDARTEAQNIILTLVSIISYRNNRISIPTEWGCGGIFSVTG
ncbi:hypothetical protein P152DRAFT_510610 [Eremomyces bilateralis CBS 781.70]|uniref:Zn(2)-C6 fungal-type domain-containing protein n=1 Tax=Eremomyces bilateralis CBS 781.70 TaxID=1392243 RepID=A0A6G1GH36_9PEZI|nr:uncharacterized protein P152DRAFT_510610 [Eremomyces bilateralis CBS 781.70]KAF1817363.1 hypothetical protein P152DRAFT_510610 [Eremomyces bilateralis CBS 781.70]